MVVSKLLKSWAIPPASSPMASIFWYCRKLDSARSRNKAEDKILATPTLAKILPPPVRKIIGDLSDREKVLIGLDLLFDELNDAEMNF